MSLYDKENRCPVLFKTAELRDAARKELRKQQEPDYYVNGISG